MSKNFALHQTADTLETELRNQKLLNLPVDWGDEILYPAYDGLSIRNVPHTIGQLLDAPLDDAVLDNRVWGDTNLDGVQRVVTFLSDGLGYLYLRELMDEDPELEDTILQLTDGRGFVPLTSIAPSTTAVALPTLWTGATPATHGMIGTSLFLREYSTYTNMLFNKSIGNLMGSVIPERDFSSFVPSRSFAEHLTDYRVPTHLLMFKGYLGNGFLSAVLHRGVGYSYAHGGYSDVWVRLAEVLQETVGKRCYVHIYHSPVDSLSHLYGAKNQYIHYEIKEQMKQLLAVLSSQSVKDGQTLFMLIADHGHANAPDRIDLQDDEAEFIRRQMRLGLTGDMRLGHLHLQNDTTDDVIHMVHTQFGDRLAAVETSQAIDAGLFGHDTVYSETKHRLGDVVLIPRLGTQVIDSSLYVLDLESWHGGLSPEEMLVPFMYTRL